MPANIVPLARDTRPRTHVYTFKGTSSTPLECLHLVFCLLTPVYTYTHIPRPPPIPPPPTPRATAPIDLVAPVAHTHIHRYLPLTTSGQIDGGWYTPVRTDQGSTITGSALEAHTSKCPATATGAARESVARQSLSCGLLISSSTGHPPADARASPDRILTTQLSRANTTAAQLSASYSEEPRPLPLLLTRAGLVLSVSQSIAVTPPKPYTSDRR